MTELTDKTFSKAIQASPVPILVDFWANWCGPCRAMMPVLEKVAAEFDGKVRFAKMNIDENEKIPAHYEVQAIPTLMLFRDGDKVGEIVGTVTKTKLAAFLREHTAPEK